MRRYYDIDPWFDKTGFGYLNGYCLFTGEMLERMTFFTALSAPRMPGGLQ
jgi:hypothetical protein